MYQYGVPTNEFAGDFIEADPKSAKEKDKMMNCFIFQTEKKTLDRLK